MVLLSLFSAIAISLGETLHCFITEIEYLCSSVKCFIFVTLGGSNNKHLYHSDRKRESFSLFPLKKYLLFYPIKLHLLLEFKQSFNQSIRINGMRNRFFYIFVAESIFNS